MGPPKRDFVDTRGAKSKAQKADSQKVKEAAAHAKKKAGQDRQWAVGSDAKGTAKAQACDDKAASVGAPT